jgi:hypothetical protein
LYTYKHTAFSAILVFAGALLIDGCREKSQLPHPDVSDISVDIEIKRFEKPFMAANQENYGKILGQLEQEDSAFFDLYCGQILSIRGYGDSAYQLYDTLYKYMIADEYMMRLYDSVQAIYPNLDEVEAELENALRYYSYYFPGNKLPQFYTYVAPFVYQVVVAEEVIGIELNMFMGANFSYYGAMSANLPRYMVYRFDQRYMVVSVMRALMDGNLPSKGAEANLLDEMLTEGKMMYYLDLMLPDTPDSIKIGYTAAQMEWCEANESDIWKFFAGEELFFSTRNQDKQRYLAEAPNAFGMPEGSPGRIGIWVGWQMVRSYMATHPETTLEVLFNMTDATLFLKESKYKP